MRTATRIKEAPAKEAKRCCVSQLVAMELRPLLAGAIQ